MVLIQLASPSVVFFACGASLAAIDLNACRCTIGLLSSNNLTSAAAAFGDGLF